MSTIVGTPLTERGIKSAFFEHLGATATVYQDLSTRLESNKGAEKFGFLGSLAPMRAWGTGRLIRGLFTETYEVENLRYELTLEVDRIELADDQTGQIRIRIEEMARRAALHKDSEIGRLLSNGHSAGFHSFDGVPMFSASHVFGNSPQAAQSNLLTPDAQDADAPTTAEFRAALAAGIQRMLEFKDDQGEPMSMSAGGLVAVVPPNMYLTALEAVNTTITASLNANILQGAARVIVLPYLSDGAVFYLCKNDGFIRPFIFQDREPIEFVALEGQSDTGFMREKYLYGVRARYRMTYGHWAYALKLTFTEGG